MGLSPDPYTFEARLTHFAPFHQDTALSNMRAVLQQWGNPHHHLPPVIHVAGTNGKGSTVAMLRSVLEAAGYRVHAITSPHLTSLNERLLLAGVPVDLTLLNEALNTHESLAHAHHLTWFEHLICVSLLLCTKTPADVLLLEVGLGGEYDATNVIEKPALSILTPISADHCEAFGTNVQTIAHIKAGIMKRDCPVLSAPQLPEVLTVLQQIAGKNACPFTELSQEDNTFPYSLNLSGPHQEQNARVVVAALKTLKTLFPINTQALETGFQQIQWKGRLENLGTYKGQPLWFDVAHNPASAKVLANFFQQKPDAKTLMMALGASKDAPETLRPLLPVFDQIIFFKPQHAAPFHDPQALQEIARTQSYPTHIADTLPQAFDSINPSSLNIVVAGSHYFAGELYKFCGPSAEFSLKQS